MQYASADWLDEVRPASADLSHVPQKKQDAVVAAGAVPLLVALSRSHHPGVYTQQWVLCEIFAIGLRRHLVIQ